MRSFFFLLLCLLLVLPIMAQDATPSPEPESTPEVEATPELTPEAEATAELTPEPDAAEICPSIVNQALTLTQQGCENTGTNEACYGHVVLDAELRSDLRDTISFNQPGDTVDVIALRRLSLSAMNLITGQWGVLLMAVEATLQAATSTNVDPVEILLFGDVELDTPVQFIRVTANTNLNVRRRPDPASERATTLRAGETIIANSRLEDNSWLRVRLSGDQGGGVGWVRADLVEADGEVETLNVIPTEDALAGTPDELATYGPMQAFYFRSADNDSLCPEAPDSGILIQTPEGVASISIWMDEVVVDLSGTGYVQAQPNGSLTFTTLEGTANVTALGETRTVIAGTLTEVQLDGELSPVEAPSDPRPLDEEDIAGLPLGLLGRGVEVMTPRQPGPGEPLDGNWTFNWNVSTLSCPDGTVVEFGSTGQPGTLVLRDQAIEWGGIRYDQVSQGVYEASFVDPDGSLHRVTLQVTAPDRISGEDTIDYVEPAGCTLTVPFSIRLDSPVS